MNLVNKNVNNDGLLQLHKNTIPSSLTGKKKRTRKFTSQYFATHTLSTEYCL